MGKSEKGFYDLDENVDQYIKIADGYDGKELVTLLRDHLPKASSVLELGMGPGKDLLLLSEFYQVTGSDSSSIFVNRFKDSHPEISSFVLEEDDSLYIIARKKADLQVDCIKQ